MVLSIPSPEPCAFDFSLKALIIMLWNASMTFSALSGSLSDSFGSLLDGFSSLSGLSLDCSSSVESCLMDGFPFPLPSE